MTETPETQAPAEGVAADAGQAAETGQGSSTFSSFAGEDLGYIQNKGWDKEGGIEKMVDSYKNLESMRGVPEDRLLKLPEGEDGWDDVYKKLGKPDTFEEYAFEAPEGADIDQGRMDWFSKTAHEANLTKAQHNKMVAASMEYESNIINAREEAAAEERTIELNDLKDKWGNAYDERVELGKRAVRAFASEDGMVDKLEDAMGSNAAVIKFFAKLGEGISEHKLPSAEGERQFGKTPAQYKDEITTLKNEIKGDPERLATFNNNIGADVEKLARLRKLANG